VNPKEFRAIRERIGLTQRELSEVFGLSGYTPISHYESGFRKPSALIAALMRIFDELPAQKSRELRDFLLREMKQTKPMSRGKS
jgi:DNA-binding transcriptional regulator YiaG